MIEDLELLHILIKLCVKDVELAVETVVALLLTSLALHLNKYMQ